MVGTARVVKTPYPDFTAWDPKSKHFYPKSASENPIWYIVDICLESQFAELRMVPVREEMTLLCNGMRLSIQPVTAKEFDIIVAMENPRGTLAKSLINRKTLQFLKRFIGLQVDLAWQFKRRCEQESR